MPGPSGLPNTLASCGAELAFAVNSPIQHSLRQSSGPVHHSLSPDSACSDQLPTGAAAQVDHDDGVQPQEMLPQAINDEGCLAAPCTTLQQDKGVLQRHALDAAAAAAATERSAERATDGASVCSQTPVIQHGAVLPITAYDQQHTNETSCAADDASPLRPAICEETVLPDSVGPTQQGRPAASMHEPGESQMPSSARTSQTGSEDAALQAVLGLTALASGDKRLNAATADASAADEPASGRRPRLHKQCDSNRAPLKTIQRGAAVQRQPLKPAWQCSGRGQPHWGATGRRNRLKGNSPKGKRLSDRGNNATQRHKSAQRTQGQDRQQAALDIALTAARPDAVCVAHNKACAGSKQAEAEQPETHKAEQPKAEHAEVQQSKAEQAGAEQTEAEQRETERAGPEPTEAEQIAAGTTCCSHATGNIKSQPESGSKQPADKQPGRARPQAASQRQTSKLAAPVNKTAQQKAVGHAINDDDDDFKPVIQRRSKMNQSPKDGSKKRAKLAMSETPPSTSLAEFGPIAHADPVGQMLLTWNAAKNHWDRRFVTAFDASKVSRNPGSVRSSSVQLFCIIHVLYVCHLILSAELIFCQYCTHAAASLRFVQD